MPEKKLRAIIFGAILWVALFVISLFVMTKLSEDRIGTIVLFVAPIISLPLAFWYMVAVRDKSSGEGLRLGGTWFVMHLTFDVIAKVYLLGFGWEYFSIWNSWIAYVEIILFTSFVGGLLKPEPDEEAEEIEIEEKKERTSIEEGEAFFTDKK